MKSLKQINLKFWWQHLLFWIGVWLLYIYFYSYQSSEYTYVAWFATFLLPVTIVTAYYFGKVIIPKYLLQKQYGYFALYTFTALILSAYASLMAIMLCLMLLSNYSLQGLPFMSRNVFFMLVLMYLVIGLVSFYYLLRYNFEQVAQNKDLQNKILTTQLQLKEQELNYLKKQIHPHFLFNTLNTIYGFALKQSEKTPEMILRLSNLLDYILYQVQKPSVLLTDEINHIQNYVALESIRFRETLKVDVEINGQTDNTFIPPMLLIPFVENAFKHGRTIEGFLTVKMEIAVLEGDLIFILKNTTTEQSNITKHGIGLNNIQKRLELLYPNRYNLDVENEDNWYNVYLSINEIEKYETIEPILNPSLKKGRKPDDSTQRF